MKQDRARFDNRLSVYREINTIPSLIPLQSHNNTVMMLQNEPKSNIEEELRDD